MVRQSENSFRIVGAGYVNQEKTAAAKLRARDHLRGKPVVSFMLLLMTALGCVFAGMLANHDPTVFYLENVNEAPGGEFIFGTDSMGRDIYSMIWYGGRVSLGIGLMAAAISAVIGTVYGCISGTAGVKTDALMMRLAEMCGSIPSLLFVLIISAAFQADGIISLSVVIGTTGWFGLARIVRSEVRQIRNFEYVLYARSCGGSFMHVMLKHLVPNFLSAVMFVIISSIGNAITMESSLSFLGLGLPVDVLSWGSMLSLADRALIMGSWWVIIFPGVFLVVTLLCITDVGAYFRRETNKRHGNL